MRKYRKMTTEAEQDVVLCVISCAWTDEGGRQQIWTGSTGVCLWRRLQESLCGRPGAQFASMATMAG